MSTKIKDAAVVTSKYTSNGSEKAHWTNVGGLYKKDDGSLFLSLNAFFNFSALPRNDGSDRVIIGLFDPKKREDSYNNSNSNSSYSQDSNNADIPF
jgi:hypothetical protein